MQLKPTIKNIRDLMTAHERWKEWFFYKSVNKEANYWKGLLQAALFHATNPGNEDGIWMLTPYSDLHQTDPYHAAKCYDVACSILLSELNS
jgi:hypothetical protein